VARGLPKTVRDNLEKCRAAAVASVDAYNRPGPRFRTANYIVLVTIAWTALFHAIFYKRGRRPWYRRPVKGSGIRYARVDGEPKHWDLTECMAQYFGGNNPPERRNLEFLVGLRNKIEHRHLPELDASLYGECQSALLNLEELLVAEFGKKYALVEQLAVSLQFSQMIPAEKKQATKALTQGSARSVAEYVERFRGGLPVDTLNSMKYAFSVFLVPRVANRQSAADAAVQFVRVDDASPEELQRLTRLNVLIRDKHIPIANLDMFKASQVVPAVLARLTVPFGMGMHTKAWKHYSVRPPSGDPHPDRTMSQYCVYDPVHRDYVYTQAWIDFLAKELADPQRYALLTGGAPTALPVVGGADGPQAPPPAQNAGV